MTRKKALTFAASARSHASLSSKARKTDHAGILQRTSNPSPTRYLGYGAIEKL